MRERPDPADELGLRLPVVGDSFAGYRIDALLGQGGMGVVYRATHERLERSVALKLVRPEAAGNADFRRRFLRESRLAASLHHPNVVTVYDAGERAGLLYLAMRDVRGRTLGEEIAARGIMPVDETMRISEQVAAALDAAHAAGLVHRDVKPANILVSEPGPVACLCDFGLATGAPEDASRPGRFAGSIDYAAPEQIQGRTTDGRADVYALGGVLVHCLTGRPPYQGESSFAVLRAHVEDPPPSLRRLRPDLPPELDRVIARALAKDPAERFPSAGRLVSAMREALGDPARWEATQAAPALEPRRSPYRPARRVRLRRGWSGRRLAVAAVLVAAVAGLGAALVGKVPHRAAAGAPPPGMRAFVDRVEGLLERSSAGRQALADAVAGGVSCSMPTALAAERAGAIVHLRQRLLADVDRLPAAGAGERRVATLLRTALQRSLEADRHYRDGLAHADAGSGCPLPRTLEFRLAALADADASTAKRRFAATFDPLAVSVGRRVWAPGEL